jgi:hypothetical protein
MFCPQCGTESTGGQPYCRNCGANLKLIGKAVTLSEAVARSDRGPLPHLKEMMKKFNAEGAGEEISKAFEQVSTEITKHAKEAKERRRARGWRRRKTASERRERLRVRGITSIFSGTGLTLFLYFLTGASDLHLPSDVVARIPFEVNQVLHIIWVIGLIPVFAGFGRLLAASFIKDDPPELQSEPDLEPAQTHSLPEPEPNFYEPPTSVTDRTTNILEHVKRAQ